MDRLRVASLQYLIRPVTTFDEFRDQVYALVETAEDYRSRMVVFPEYFSTQLLTLGDVRRPIDEQIRYLASQAPRTIELLAGLARRFRVYIVAGTIPVADADGRIYNDCHVFNPSGEFAVQGKLHMTRFEREEWGISARSRLKIMDTAMGRIGVAICYDVEFPEIARTAARHGAQILVVPSCTDDRRGFLRVRYCAHARAVENHMYVVQAVTVGSIPMVPAVSLNYGQASILSPCDFSFPRDGILAEGNVNDETMVIGDLDMKSIEENRSFGTVLPLHDSHRTAELIADPEVVAL